MSNFYTSAVSYRGDILFRGIKDGNRIQRRVKAKPYLFVKSSDPNSTTKYRTIKNDKVERIDFDSIADARDFIKKYENVSGFDIYGMTQWQYPFLNDLYGSSLNYAADEIRVALLDIETMADGAFPNIKEADKEVTAITINFRKHNYVFGLYPYTPKDNNTTYYQCRDEKELLNRFIDKLKEIDPDVVSGWNSGGFDIPYITNRCIRILGEERTKDLSPWRIIDRKEIVVRGKAQDIITWVGIASLDYIDVYRKFRSATRESYKLDYIANFELGSNKIDYAEYGSLHGLYLGNKQLYYEYNEHDVNLLVQMEDKLGLFNILYSLAYYMGCNFNDTFATVRPWDVKIHNWLMARNIVVNPLKITSGYTGIEGAYVRDPEPGLHEWIASFDINSLYPSLARQCNISPETYITTIPGVTVDQLLERRLDAALKDKLIEENASLCATGCVFDNSVEGFIPAVMREVYEERVEFRKKEKAAKAKLEAAKDELRRRGLM